MVGIYDKINGKFRILKYFVKDVFYTLQPFSEVLGKIGFFEIEWIYKVKNQYIINSYNTCVI